MKDADGNDVTYSVSFVVTGSVATENDVNTLMQSPTARDNFVRLEENGYGVSKWDPGGNSGYLTMEDFNKNKTTPAHEYGHGLGYSPSYRPNFRPTVPPVAIGILEALLEAALAL